MSDAKSDRPKAPTARTMNVKVEMLKELELPNNGTDWNALIAPYADWTFLRGDHIDVVLLKPGGNADDPQIGDFEVLDGFKGLAWRKAHDVWEFHD